MVIVRIYSHEYHDDLHTPVDYCVIRLGDLCFVFIVRLLYFSVIDVL